MFPLFKKRAYLVNSAVLCVGIGLWGCGANEPAAKSTADTAASETAALSEFQKALAELLQTAAKQERDGNYSAAMATWAKVVPHVEAEHGKESWQFKNANLAVTAAKQRSELPAAQQNLIKQLAISESSGMQAIHQNPREAAYHLEEAEKLARQIYGDDSHLVQNVRMAQAQAVAELGEARTAIDQYGKIFAWRSKHLGKDHPDTLETMSQLGLVQQKSQDWNAAANSLNMAVAISRNVWGDAHLQTAVHLNNLAMLEYAVGQYDRAAVRLEEVLKARQALAAKMESALPAASETGKISPQLAKQREAIAHTLYNLGNVELKRGRLQPGTDYLGQAWQHVDPDGKGLAKLVGTAYAHALSAQRNYPPAEVVMKKIKSWQEAAGGTAHPDFPDTLYQIAIIQGNQGKFVEAEPNLAEALRLERAAGSQSNKLSEMLTVHAQLLRRTGDLAAAESAEAELERLRGGGVQTATRPF